MNTPPAGSSPNPFNHAARELIAAFRGVANDVPARQVRRSTKSLGPLLEELLVKHQIGRAAPEDAIRENWPAVVGPAIAHYSHAGQIDPRGKLVVLYNQAVAGNELRFHQAAILARIRALPGCDHVKSLAIRAG
jgi:predicted nucleic acid-binding Zn ribbon protein